MSRYETLRAPHPSPAVRHHAWAVNQTLSSAAVTDTATGIFHADLACPVMQNWFAKDPYCGHRLYEIDTATGSVEFVWARRTTPTNEWERTPSVLPPDLGEMRPCLRCGSAAANEVVVCSACFLTPCWCD